MRTSPLLLAAASLVLAAPTACSTFGADSTQTDTEEDLRRHRYGAGALDSGSAVMEASSDAAAESGDAAADGAATDAAPGGRHVYVAQTAQGANTGEDCADAYGVAFVDDPSHWGAGPTQIGPDTTIHLCGKFTAAPGGTMLTVHGSGSSDHPVTFRFEPGALLSAPYWGSSTGAISCTGFTNIVIDGGGDGAIVATDNGTALAYQQSSAAIRISCSNVEIKNLTIRNLYQRHGQGSDGIDTFAIAFAPGSDHVAVHHSTLSNARSLVFVAYDVATDVQIHDNVMDYSSWMIVMGDNNDNSHASGVVVYRNQMGPHFSAWQDTAQTMHADGIFLFAVNAGSSLTGDVHDNYVHGDMGGVEGVNSTGYVFLEGKIVGAHVFNNIVSHEVTTGVGVEADIVIRGCCTSGQAPNDVAVYNNTIASVTQSAAGIKTDGYSGASAGSGLAMVNNIFYDLGYGVLSGPANFDQIATSDHNDFFKTAIIGSANVTYGPSESWNTLLDWQRLGFDGDGTTGDPLLDAQYRPPPGSAAIGVGMNLFSVCTAVGALCQNFGGALRPASGPWTAGAW